MLGFILKKIWLYYIVSLPLPETPSLPGKSVEVDASSTTCRDVFSFKSGVDEVVSLTTLDLLVGIFTAAVVDTNGIESVLLRSTLDILVVFLRAGVVDINWDENVLLSEVEFEDIVWPWNVLLCKVVELFSTLLENVVTSDSVEDVFEGSSFDVFWTSTQSAGRWSLHLWILLSTSPFCFILAATQKIGFSVTSKKNILN